MKYIHFLTRLILPLAVAAIFSGCVTPWRSYENSTGQIQQSYWSEYYLTQCNESVWGEDTAEQVISYYQSNYDITIETVEFIQAQDDFVSCSACGCPTGDVVKVQTNFADRLELLELGFVKDGETMPIVEDTRITEDTENTESTSAEGGSASGGEVIEDAGITENEEGAENTEVLKNANVNEKTPVEINDATTTTDAAPTEPTAEDKTLEDKAAQVQQALVDYYSKNKNYPEKLDQLGVDLGDLTGINYTPIGTVPASYYDMTVEYSTGKITINP